MVAHIPPTSSRATTEASAMVLESSGRADPEVLAVHFHGALEHERAGTYYAQAAAQAAEALAFDRAAKLYRLALELRPGDDALARGLRMGLADALANAGRGPEAAREYLAAVAGATVAEALELRRRAAMQFLITGHLDEGHTQLGAVLKAVAMTLPEHAPAGHRVPGPESDQDPIAWTSFSPARRRSGLPEDLTRIEVSWTAANGLGMIDPIRASDFQARNLLLALRAGEPYRIGRAICMEAGYVSFAGGRSHRRVSKLVRIAEEIAQQVDNPHISGGVFGGAGSCGVHEWPVEAGMRAPRPGRRHLPHALHRRDL